MAVTYTNGTVRFYVNGELTDTIAQTYSMGANSQPVLFSRSTEAFNGWMDDIRLYPDALPPHEIRALTGMREYTYDAKGNLTGDRVWGYAYDHENRLTVASNGALRIDYRYDALGRLIERRTSGSSATSNRMYYAGWQLIAEYNGTGTLQRKYVYGPGIDEPVRMRFTGGVGTNYYYHADGLGSVTEITTTTGTKTESYSYDVYGTPTIYNASGTVISTPSTGNRLLFTGRDRDPDTTLYNYRYRYYSPSLGRFVQPDPINIAGGDLNLYRYTWNNPVNYTDSLGLDAYLFFDSTGGPGFSPGSGHVGVGVDSGGKVLRRDAAWGSTDPLGKFDTKEKARLGSDIVVILPNKKLPGGRSSDDVIAEKLKSGKSKKFYPYCSNYAAEVLKTGGYNVGRGFTPQAVLNATKKLPDVKIEIYKRPDIPE